ncbi:MAG: NfeD family protein [Lachnospiraceae bacterium]|nr:NfeD family protein [Lachnospiraceae bacterium]
MGALGWLIAVIAFAGIEAATMALTTIWFAGGSLAALILCLLGAGLEIQLAVFVIVSFALLALTRPLALRYLNRRTKKTNVESLVGKQARITETVDNLAGTGTAVVNGQEWTARAADEGKTIPSGALVVIREIRGVKLMVEPVSGPEEG